MRKLKLTEIFSMVEISTDLGQKSVICDFKLEALRASAKWTVFDHMAQTKSENVAEFLTLVTKIGLPFYLDENS